MPYNVGSHMLGAVSYSFSYALPFLYMSRDMTPIGSAVWLKIWAVICKVLLNMCHSISHMTFDLVCQMRGVR